METQQENNNQEIDLVFLAKKIKGFFLSIGFLILRLINFIIRNKIIVIILFILGISLGVYFDKKSKNNFKTEVVVVPNFESVDLLYAEVENFKSNLNSNKSKYDFLNDVVDLRIESIENINSILTDKDNLEIFKVLTSNGQDLSKILKNEEFKKNYKYHLITLKTNSSVNSQKIIDFLLNTINSKPYYKQRSAFAIKNQTNAKQQAEKSIEQINKILENLGNGSVSVVGKDLNINSYDQLSNVIEMKDYYMKKLVDINTKLIEYKSTIYPVNTSFNNKIHQKIYEKMVVILPLFLIGFYLFLSYIKYLYAKYNNLYQKTKITNA
ncbi:MULTISPECIES: hypothetical protein [Empedobacter]|uniref:Uncharacterized protein n=1 Tax=Empedobacter falsenii TaxID=343874 RepID=A0A427BRP6_9FLAO|nr:MULTISPECIES: hypothetical protein [Empedobacter]MDM1138827.1 hypothetical protein [Empedobacter sp. R132-2]RRT93420.1 hypothetical protein EGI89_03180 [Empedobacter falsenii]RRT93566.1 hypothetical protein EGI88_03190 [Empedobacter falsenii]